MPPQTIIVATASNAAYFQGLCVTIASAAISTSCDFALRFYILDTGLTEKNHADLTRLISSLRNDCEIIFLKTADDCFSGMNTDYGGGYSTYARLLISSLVPEEKAIYLDADFLVLRDLAELWSESIAPHLMLATTDLDSATAQPKLLSRDCPFLPGPEADRFHYHNCGFLFIDLDAWRRENIEGVAFDRVKGFETQLKAWDQTLLNYVLRGRIGRLPGTWNQSCSIDGIPGEANIHYISMRKPWNHWSPIPMYQAWYCFYRLFVQPMFPLRLPFRAKITGALRYLRDRLLVKYPPLKHLYFLQLKKNSNPRTATAYEQHLQQLTNALANPAWHDQSKIIHLKQQWMPHHPLRISAFSYGTRNEAQGESNESGRNV